LSHRSEIRHFMHGDEQNMSMPGNPVVSQNVNTAPKTSQSVGHACRRPDFLVPLVGGSEHIISGITPPPSPTPTPPLSARTLGVTAPSRGALTEVMPLSNVPWSRPASCAASPRRAPGLAALRSAAPAGGFAGGRRGLDATSPAPISCSGALRRRPTAPNVHHGGGTTPAVVPSLTGPGGLVPVPRGGLLDPAAARPRGPPQVKVRTL
jgi:hypothetical protein